LIQGSPVAIQGSPVAIQNSRWPPDLYSWCPLAPRRRSPDTLVVEIACIQSVACHNTNMAQDTTGSHLSYAAATSVVCRDSKCVMLCGKWSHFLHRYCSNERFCGMPRVLS